VSNKKEISLFELVCININKTYSKEAAVSFAKDPCFKGCDKCEDNVQRGLINRVMINKLFIFRAYNDTSVVDIIYCLLPDGDNESWMNVFKIAVLPFLAKHQVKL
jgi:hypothetical protein